MAENANVRLLTIQPGLRVRGHLPSFIQDMTERDRQTGPLKEAPPWKAARFKVIDIAGHRRHWGESTEPPNHPVIADIAGMQDFLNSSKMALDRRVVDPMGIGDHSDSKRPTLGQRLAAPADA